MCTAILVLFLLCNSPASEFYMPTFRTTLFHLLTYLPMKMEQSFPQRRRITLRRGGNYPEESVQHSEHGESLKSIVLCYCHRVSTQLQLTKYISYHNIYHVISYHTMSYHIMSYRIISYHISYHIIYHIISYHIIYHTISYIISYHLSCHVIYHTMSYHIISYIIPYHIISYHLSCHVIYHTMSYHIISYHIMSYHIIYHITYHVMSYIIPCHIISYHIIPCHITSYHVISYHIIYHTTSYHILSCHNMSYRILSCHIISIPANEQPLTHALQSAVHEVSTCCFLHSKCTNNQHPNQLQYAIRKQESRAELKRNKRQKARIKFTS